MQVDPVPIEPAAPTSPSDVVAPRLPGNTRAKRGTSPFRNAVLRGLGVLLPPLLTIVILLWIGGTIESYVLDPLIAGAERLVLLWTADIRQGDAFPPGEQGKGNPVADGVTFQRLDNGEYVPKAIYDVVQFRPGDEGMPRTALQVYKRYVRLTYLRPHVVIPAFILVFTLLLYVLGKLMAAGIGRFLLAPFEGGIRRVPFVRTVYSAVKQVSGFLLDERQMRVSRVVAVEYPRKGIWQLGLVTGEGMPDIEAVVGEPCLSVLMCTSPMPMTGFTVVVRRSECLDLNITLDQAIQFVVSCGVIVPRPEAPGAIQSAPSAKPLLTADGASGTSGGEDPATP